MRILCLVIPHLPVSVERRDESALEGRPLVIVQEGEVMDCSPETLDEGVRMGMRIERAEKLCPEALPLTADIIRYQGAFEGVLKSLAEVSPVLEGKRWGEAYADISGQASGFEGEAFLCQEVGRNLEQEVGLKGMMGVTGNKFTSYVAARSIGWGQALLLRPGTEQELLARLPVDLLPINEEMLEELRLLGIRSMGQFAQLPAGAVLARFGSQGRKAHQLAQGQDRRPLIPYQSPQVVEATLEFEPPLEMNEMLVRVVGKLVHTCCQRLHKRGLACQEVYLILSFGDGGSHSAQWTLSGPTAAPEMVRAPALELVHPLSCAGRVTEARIVLRRLQTQEGKQLNLGVITRPAKVDLVRLVRPLVTKFGADRFYEGRVLNFSSPLAEFRFAWQTCVEEGERVDSTVE